MKHPSLTSPLQILQAIKVRPGMFLPRVDFDTAVAFVDGMNYGCQGGLLVGLREWLIVRLDGPNNLVWHGLVRRHVGTVTAGAANEAEITALFELLEEFFQVRESEGLPEIFRKYDEWLKRPDPDEASEGK